MFRRYSDPEKMIELQMNSGALTEYFSYILQQEAIEEKERKLWDLYLQIADKTEMTFKQWREEVTGG